MRNQPGKNEQQQQQQQWQEKHTHTHTQKIILRHTRQLPFSTIFEREKMYTQCTMNTCFFSLSVSLSLSFSRLFREFCLLAKHERVLSLVSSCISCFFLCVCLVLSLCVFFISRAKKPPPISGMSLH